MSLEPESCLDPVVDLAWFTGVQIPGTRILSWTWPGSQVSISLEPESCLDPVVDLAWFTGVQIPGSRILTRSCLDPLEIGGINVKYI